MKFLNTIRVEELKNILEKISTNVLEEELIPLEESYNRVLSRDIMSNIDVPHFRKARMDGYAVIAKDTFNADEDKIITLELIEIIDAGTIPKQKIKKGQCSYVATGAAIPDDADGVVMVEFTNKNNNKIHISKAITPGTHLINIGADIQKDQIIYKKNQLINLPTLGIFSSCGIHQIPVYKKITVSLISTGNEIVPISSKKLEIGKIYDVNSIMLKKAIENIGIDVLFLGIVKDNFRDLEEVIYKGLENSDIVILSGGTSKGEGDLAPKVLEKFQNIEILIHGVKIKPGKPLIFAKLKEKIIFILPGYPTSALSCFYIFIDDFLRRISKLPLKKKSSKKLEIGERIYSSIGRHEFKPVKIEKQDGIERIFPIKTGSEAISTMFYADGYIEIEELESIVEKGDIRQFNTF
ncbi:MAG: molybdopterin molybdotransferase MoeA [Candidatus Lokiarchaeota archaeon]|nr:molybdopterin molybdotransferase MoeA [Candidatus Lokiarchaeota archaeon]